jgi:lysophospholipase L1-like esterase
MTFLRRFILFYLVCAASASATETNQIFAKWEKAISAYEQADSTNPPPKGAIEFIGSSTIRRWKTLAQDFPGEPVFNRGFGGSRIADSTHFAPRVIFPYAPRMIFLRAGGNDLWAGEPPEQVFADFKDFVETVHARLPETTIVFISWSPTPSRWRQHEEVKTLNALVADYVRGKPFLQYIETYDLTLGPDGRPRTDLFTADETHFNAKGYTLLVGRVRPFLPK